MAACAAPPLPPAQKPTSTQPPAQAPASEPAAKVEQPPHTLLATGIATKAVTKPKERSLVYDPELFDPSGTALAAFYDQLRAIERGERKHVRIAFFGASHVASDLFTNVVRNGLQRRFGDAGPGFVLPAKPYPWHRHGRVTYTRSRGFESHQVRVRSRKVQRYGLAGIALDGGTKLRALSGIQTRSSDDVPGGVSQIELYYWRQPGGGRLRVLIDGKAIAMLTTDAKTARPGYRTFEVERGEHLVELRTQADGPVRVFGVSLENAGKGVVLDTLGIPGARARYQLLWDQPLFQEHLKRRDPGLIVLAYGTNESGDDDDPIEHYEAQLTQVIERLQETVPGASCLLVGPSDRPIRDKKAKTIEDRPRTLELVEAQKRVAKAEGCAFFDLVAMMGGPLSMERWVDASPPLGARDYVHFTAKGYREVGEVLFEDMMRAYVPAVPLPLRQQMANDANGKLNEGPSIATRQKPSAKPCNKACP